MTRFSIAQAKDQSIEATVFDFRHKGVRLNLRYLVDMSSLYVYIRWILRYVVLSMWLFSRVDTTFVDVRTQICAQQPSSIFASQIANMLPCIPQQRQRLFDTTSTTLYSSSIKFKNFDMMLDAYREEPVLIHFSSNLCGGCTLQKKELVNVLRNTMKSTTNAAFTKKILTIDADMFPQICLRFNVTKLPCMLLVKDGTILMRFDGFTTSRDILQRLITS
jgi:Thioredoxin